MGEFEKIKLSKNSGPIVFLGSMNAMPMMYAIELKQLGYDVLYFVDRPKRDTLSRPENHYSSIPYPYPNWVVEINLKSQMIVPLSRWLSAKYLEYIIKSKHTLNPQAYVLNGFFVSLAPFLNKSSTKISLSHGSDLHSWADIDEASNLVRNFSKRSLFKFLPYIISNKLIKLVVRRQFNGFATSSLVIYFPRGFNLSGDRVLSRLEGMGVHCFERYDISFEPLKGQSRRYKKISNKLVVFSGVRFLYKSFPEGSGGRSKGNDMIIRSLSRFYKNYQNLEVHFVEKGEDVEAAKELCVDTGLSPVVVWHKEMEFYKLIELYHKADICFDQVGEHWIGAIGGYALYLGKPLIANDSIPVSLGLWPQANPILTAKSSDEIVMALEQLLNDEFRKQISDQSKIFVEKYMSPQYLLNNVFCFFSV